MATNTRKLASLLGASGAGIANDGTLTSAAIGEVIVAGDIAAGAVDTAELASGAVTDAKLDLTTPALGTPASGILTNATFPNGHVVQVVQSQYTTHFTQTINSGDGWDYLNDGSNDLKVAITPSDNSHKILVTFSIGALTANTGASGGHGLGVVIDRGGTAISINTSGNGNPHGSFIAHQYNGTYSAHRGSYSVLDSPATTSEVVYKLKLVAHSNSDYVIGFNRSLTAGNYGYDGYKTTTASNFIAMEIVA